MKINFDGSFQDVQRLVRASVRPVKEPVNFEKLLADVSPEARQSVEITQDNLPVSQAPESLDESARARFNFPVSQPNMPSIELVAPPQIESAVVNNAASGVKTPTPEIIGAQRVDVRGASARSSVSQTAQIDVVKRITEDAGRKHGVDPLLSMAVIKTESSFNPRAVSSDGHFSKGLMQLLDTTGRRELKEAGEDRHYDPFDPHLNIDLGVSYLRRMHDLFSKESPLPNKLNTAAAANSSSLEKLAVAAYNAGEGRVASAQARAERAGKNPGLYEEVSPYLPETTREYVSKVMSSKSGMEDDIFG